MQYVDGQLVFSATDLNNFLECRRLTELEDMVARGLAQSPADEDEQTKLVRRKGEEHEARFLERLRAEHGTGVVSIERTAAAASRAIARRKPRRSKRCAAACRSSTRRRSSTAISRPRRLPAPRRTPVGARRVELRSPRHEARAFIEAVLFGPTLQLQRTSARACKACAPRHGYIMLGNDEEQRSHS